MPYIKDNTTFLRQISPAPASIKPAHTRESKCDKIRAFFLANIGKGLPTAELHSRFGTAFRTRMSDLNPDEDCPIFIQKGHHHSVDADESWYFSEWRSPQQPQQLSVAWASKFPKFGDLALESGYPD